MLNDRFPRITSDYEVNQFFNMYYVSMGQADRNVWAYELYLFLNRLPLNKPSCLLKSASCLSNIPDVFHEYNYTNQLVSLYKAYAITIILENYELCNDIDFTVRAEMLISILNEIRFRHLEKENLLVKNFIYIMDNVDYFHPLKVDYEILFKDADDVEHFVNTINELYANDKKRRFEILFSIYKNYIKYTEFTDIYLRTVTQKTKVGIILSAYPLYKFFTNIKKYVYGDIDNPDDEF